MESDGLTTPTALALGHGNMAGGLLVVRGMTKKRYITITLNCGHLELREEGYCPRVGQAVVCDLCPYVERPLPQSRVRLVVRHDPPMHLKFEPDFIDPINWH